MYVLQAINEINYEISFLQSIPQINLSHEYGLTIFNSIVLLVQDSYADSLLFSLVGLPSSEMSVIEWRYDVVDSEHLNRSGMKWNEIQEIIRHTLQPIRLRCEYHSSARFNRLDVKAQARILGKTIWNEKVNLRNTTEVIGVLHPHSDTKLDEIEQDFQILLRELTFSEARIEELLASIRFIVLDVDFDGIVFRLIQNDDKKPMVEMIYRINDRNILSLQEPIKLDEMVRLTKQLGKEALVNTFLLLKENFLKRPFTERQRILAQTIWHKAWTVS